MNNPLVDLNPDVLRMVRLKVFNEDEVTEVQINYVLAMNKVDRETFDEAVEYAKRLSSGSSKVALFILIAIAFLGMQFIFWIVELIFQN